MPKFVFNPRTGRMEPKQDTELHFGATMGGGLRVDDPKNNIKYIIERDETITWLFCYNKKLNIYDSRDAHMIAERVLRMFHNRNHKYADYRQFLKGGVVNDGKVKSFDEFINETTDTNVDSLDKDGLYQYIIDSYEFENNINVETTDDLLTVSVDLGDPENDPVLTYSYADNEIFIASENDDLRRMFNFLKKDFDCERVQEGQWVNKILFNDRPTNSLFLRIMYQFTTWFDYLYTEKD